MNVFLIPLQERISLSLLHPSLPYLSFSLSIALLYLFLSSEFFKLKYFVYFLFVCTAFCIFLFFQRLFLKDCTVFCHVDYFLNKFFTFLPFWMISIGNKACVFFFLVSSTLFNSLHFIYYLSTFYKSSFYISLIHFLSDVSRFSSRTPGVPRRDWQRKGKEHEMYFWPRAFVNV